MNKLFTIFSAVVLLFAVNLSPAVYAATIKFSGSSVRPLYPCQNATVTYKATVVNGKGTPVKGAKVTFNVHYKTTITGYNAGTSNKNGRVIKNFKIGRATPGFKVLVKSKAKKGALVSKKSTWFKPKKCS